MSRHVLVLEGLLGVLVHHPERLAVVGVGREIPTPLPDCDVVVCDLDGVNGENRERLMQLIRSSQAVVGLVHDPTTREDASWVDEVIGLDVEADTLLSLLERSVKPASPGVNPPTVMTAGLTAQEYAVIVRIGAGMSNHEIAGSMFISINTVKTYIRQAYRKMNVTSRSQAILWAVRHGMVRRSRGYVGGPTEADGDGPSKTMASG